MNNYKYGTDGLTLAELERLIAINHSYASAITNIGIFQHVSDIRDALQPKTLQEDNENMKKLLTRYAAFLKDTYSLAISTIEDEIGDLITLRSIKGVQELMDQAQAVFSGEYLYKSGENASKVINQILVAIQQIVDEALSKYQDELTEIATQMKKAREMTEQRLAYETAIKHAFVKMGSKSYPCTHPSLDDKSAIELCKVILADHYLPMHAQTMDILAIMKRKVPAGEGFDQIPGVDERLMTLSAMRAGTYLYKENESADTVINQLFREMDKIVDKFVAEKKTNKLFKDALVTDGQPQFSTGKLAEGQYSDLMHKVSDHEGVKLTSGVDEVLYKDKYLEIYKSIRDLIDMFPQKTVAVKKHRSYEEGVAKYIREQSHMFKDLYNCDRIKEAMAHLEYIKEHGSPTAEPLKEGEIFGQMLVGDWLYTKDTNPQHMFDSFALSVLKQATALHSAKCTNSNHQELGDTPNNSTREHLEEELLKNIRDNLVSGKSQMVTVGLTMDEVNTLLGK